MSLNIKLTYYNLINLSLDHRQYLDFFPEKPWYSTCLVYSFLSRELEPQSPKLKHGNKAVNDRYVRTQYIL